jgi:hypothetical protein
MFDEEIVFEKLKVDESKEVRAGQLSGGPECEGSSDPVDCDTMSGDGCRRPYDNCQS